MSGALEFSVVWVARLEPVWAARARRSHPFLPRVFAGPPELGARQYMATVGHWSELISVTYGWVSAAMDDSAIWFEDPADAAAVAIQLGEQWDRVGVETIRPADVRATRTHLPVVRPITLPSE